MPLTLRIQHNIVLTLYIFTTFRSRCRFSGSRSFFSCFCDCWCTYTFNRFKNNILYWYIATAPSCGCLNQRNFIDHIQTFRDSSEHCVAWLNFRYIVESRIVRQIDIKL